MASNSETVLCFLCEAELNQGTSKVKRKRLNGHSCIEVLQKIPLSTIESSYLCHNCHKRLKNLPGLQRKIEDEQNFVISSLSSLFQRYSRKRTHPDTSDTLIQEPQRENAELLVSEIEPSVSILAASETENISNDVDDDNHYTDDEVSVKIQYPSGPRVFQIATPWRKKGIKRLTRKSLPSFTSSITTSSSTNNLVISQVSKIINREIKEHKSVLVQYIRRFQKSAKDITWHLPHQFSKEMSKKSTIVPLGIDLHNENKLDEMCEIMDRMHNYVPTVYTLKTVSLPNEESVKVTETNMWQTLFGGDQLTVAHARGAIMIRANHDTSKDCLSGLHPTVEDWHTRMTLMKVIWNRLYTIKSPTDKGTLFQLKNLIHRTSVPGDPQSNMQATEDFLEVVLKAYIIVAAETISQENMTVTEVADKIVETFIHLPHLSTSHYKNDLVCAYSCEILTLGLLWLNYYDSIREGDGQRIMNIWKYLLLVFRLTGRRNYAKEAAILLIEFNFMCSDRLKMQIMTNRFVNTKGRTGCNMSCDLHLEHLNRRLKSAIRNLGSNIQPPAIVRAAKGIGVVEHVCTNFYEEVKKQKDSDRHNKPSSKKDLDKICEELRDSKVFQVIPARKHKSIDMKNCLLEKANNESIHDWIIERIVPYFI